jgi:hypothetical protein
MRYILKWLFPAILLAIPIMSIVIIALILSSPRYEGTLTAISGLAVATATLELAVVAYMQISETKENAIIASKPIIIPNEILDINEYIWNFPHKELTVANIGIGPALDVWGVILPPENPKPLTDSIFTYRSQKPFAPNEIRKIVFEKGGSNFLPTNKIANIQMGVPLGHEPVQGFPNTADLRDRCVIRMTITYRDIYGRKYISVFDLSQNKKWITVALKQDISKDIFDLYLLQGISTKKVRLRYLFHNKK